MRRRRRTVCLFRSTSIIFCYVCLSAFLTESTSHEEKTEKRIQRTTEQTSLDHAELTSVTTKWHHLLYGLKENPDKRMEWRDIIKDNGHTEKDQVTSYAENQYFSMKPGERITSHRKNILKGRDFPMGSKMRNRNATAFRLNIGEKGFLKESNRGQRESNVLSRLADRGAVDSRGHRKRRSDTSIGDGTIKDLIGEDVMFDEKKDANDVIIWMKVMKKMEDMTFFRVLEYIKKNHLMATKKTLISLNTTNALEATQNLTLTASMNITNPLDATQNYTLDASIFFVPNFEENKTAVQEKSERIEGIINTNGAMLRKEQEGNEEKAKNAEKKKKEPTKGKEKKEKEEKAKKKKEEDKKPKQKQEEGRNKKEKKEKKNKEEENKTREKENEKKKDERKEKEKKEKEIKEEHLAKAKKATEALNKEKEKKHESSWKQSIKETEKRKLKQMGEDQRRKYEGKNLEYALRRKAARENLLQRVEAMEEHKKAQEKSKKSRKRVKKKLKKLKKLKKASLIKSRKRKS